MDQRTTFDSAKSLLSTLSNLHQLKEQVSLLIDLEGFTRLEGRIIRIEEQQPLEKTLIKVNDADAFLLEQVIAVNGIFHSDYSEC
ncbi:MAG: hypothetical protein WKG06_37265 [Segetibacter sp.]